jgi:hypothetical protein
VLTALARMGLVYEPEMTQEMLDLLDEHHRFVEVRDPYLVADGYYTLATTLGADHRTASLAQGALLAQVGR